MGINLFERIFVETTSEDLAIDFQDLDGLFAMGTFNEKHWIRILYQEIVFYLDPNPQKIYKYCNHVSYHVSNDQHLQIFNLD